MVIGFSGPPRSGKTTVAQALASELGIACASFGDYVRSVAREKQLDENDRDVLQNIGESLVQSGWPAFCNSVLDSVNWKSGDSIVVDGIRHQQAIETIKEITSPQPFRLIYLQAADELRLERLGKKSSDMLKMDAHSTEADVKSILRDVADKCIDSSRELTSLVAEICDFMGHEIEKS